MHKHIGGAVAPDRSPRTPTPLTVAMTTMTLVSKLIDILSIDVTVQLQHPTRTILDALLQPFKVTLVSWFRWAYSRTLIGGGSRT